MGGSSHERIRFRTETGSVYALARNDEGRCWHREGERCMLWSEPINPPFRRLVRTSRIVAFLEALDE